MVLVLLPPCEIRLGEKQTLDSYLLYFAGRLDRLNDIEYYAEKRLKSLGLLDDSTAPRAI